MEFFKTDNNNNEKALLSLRSMISDSTNASLSHVTNELSKLFNTVWNNDQFSPQEIMDVFGTDAYKLFVVHLETEKYIRSLNPDHPIVNAPYEYTINEDGTVTIGDEIQP